MKGEELAVRRGRRGRDGGNARARDEAILPQEADMVASPSKAFPCQSPPQRGCGRMDERRNNRDSAAGDLSLKPGLATCPPGCRGLCSWHCAAHQPGNQSAVCDLHPCHHGVGEVHLRPRDSSLQQRRHRRHGHAHAATAAANHRRLGAHAPRAEDLGAQGWVLAFKE